MSIYKVEICGVNTAKLPLLSNEEKEDLFRRIKEGDAEARELYIKGNLRLVLSVIQRFSGNSENVDDLFQIGCIGLIKAIDNFDISQNVKFSTYAVPMIMGEVRRYLRDNSNSIRVSRSLRDTAYKAIYAREGLTRRNAKEPTLAEIADEIGVSKEDVTYALDAIQTPVSLYEPVYTDGGDPLYVMDQISDKKNVEENWVEDISQRGHESTAGAGAPYHRYAILRREDTDRGGGRDPHQPGPGEPAGEERAEGYAELSELNICRLTQCKQDVA